MWLGFPSEPGGAALLVVLSAVSGGSSMEQAAGVLGWHWKAQQTSCQAGCPDRQTLFDQRLQLLPLPPLLMWSCGYVSRVPGRAVTSTKGLENLSYEGRLKQWGLFSLEEILQGGFNDSTPGFKGGWSLSLQQEPQGHGRIPILGALKMQMDSNAGHLIQASHPMDLMIFPGPFHGLCCGSVTLQQRLMCTWGAQQSLATGKCWSRKSPWAVLYKAWPYHNPTLLLMLS